MNNLFIAEHYKIARQHVYLKGYNPDFKLRKKKKIDLEFFNLFNCFLIILHYIFLLSLQKSRLKLQFLENL